MKNWIILLAGVLISTHSVWAQSGNLKMTPEMLHFQYMTFDSGITLDCKPVLTNPDSQDWLVTCGAGNDLRKYTVHLWVTMYEKSVIPKQSYEVLYWVTDVTGPQPVGTGTSVWFKFREPTDVYQISVNASLDQDTAALYLDITPRL